MVLQIMGTSLIQKMQNPKQSGWKVPHLYSYILCLKGLILFVGGWNKLILWVYIDSHTCIYKLCRLQQPQLCSTQHLDLIWIAACRVAWLISSCLRCDYGFCTVSGSCVLNIIFEQDGSKCRCDWNRCGLCALNLTVLLPLFCREK